MSRIAFGLALSLFLAGTAAADQLKLASWNVANLAEAPGIALRGHERNEAEYQAIRDIIANIDPDIIALQEMGSLTSAQAILSSDYEIVFETRCSANVEACKHDVEDIFTAIAYKKSLGKLQKVQVPELAIEHPGDCPGQQSRPVRGGVGLEFNLNGKNYVVLSVHLKASCKKNDSEATADLLDDCQTQSKQVDILLNWMQSQKAAGKQVVVAGDFNRELLNAGDHVGAKFTGFDANIKFAPQTRECWANFRMPFSSIKQTANSKFPEIAAAGLQPVPYGPKSNAKIDFFVLSGSAFQSVPASEQFPSGDQAKVSEEATSYIKACDGRPKGFDDGGVLVFSEVEPSDHCPITMELD